jgi:transposase
LAGARRQTIVTSVLQSLRLYLPTFTLSSVLAEIDHWVDKGCSCFTALLNKLKLKSPQESVLDRVFPTPSG